MTSRTVPVSFVRAAIAAAHARGAEVSPLIAAWGASARTRPAAPDQRGACQRLDIDEPAESISARLGFSEASAFRRAVERWTGTTPAADQPGRAARR